MSDEQIGKEEMINHELEIIRLWEELLQGIVVVQCPRSQCSVQTCCGEIVFFNKSAKRCGLGIILHPKTLQIINGYTISCHDNVGAEFIDFVNLYILENTTGFWFWKKKPKIDMNKLAQYMILS